MDVHHVQIMQITGCTAPSITRDYGFFVFFFTKYRNHLQETNLVV